jgi:hypothetical protein
LTTSALSDGTWYWRMRAVKSDGMGSAWSSSPSFTIMTAP